MSFEAFLLSFCEPFLVLGHVFIIGLLLCFLELMLHGLEHDLGSMRISVLVPVMCGI